MNSGAKRAEPAMKDCSDWSAPNARPSRPRNSTSRRKSKDRVRFVLSIIEPRQAAFLLLRSQGFSYDEVASTLNLNPASVGTLLSRAQQAFRKEYIKRYGQE